MAATLEDAKIAIHITRPTHPVTAAVRVSARSSLTDFQWTGNEYVVLLLEAGMGALRASQVVFAKPICYASRDAPMLAIFD